jgi:hypothetical protein
MSVGPTFPPTNNEYYFTYSRRLTFDFHFTWSFILLICPLLSVLCALMLTQTWICYMASSLFLKLTFKSLHHFAWYAYYSTSLCSFFLKKATYVFLTLFICMYKVVNWFVVLDPSFLQAFPCSGVSYVSCSSSLDFSVRIKLLPFRLDYCLTFAFVGFWTGVLPYKQLRLIHMHKLSIWSHIGFFFH